jgi:hypothetical protein
MEVYRCTQYITEGGAQMTLTPPCIINPKLQGVFAAAAKRSALSRFLQTAMIRVFVLAAVAHGLLRGLE